MHTYYFRVQLPDGTEKDFEVKRYEPRPLNELACIYRPVRGKVIRLTSPDDEDAIYRDP